jgi:hypothetical protein
MGQGEGLGGTSSSRQLAPTLCGLSFGLVVLYLQNARLAINTDERQNAHWLTSFQSWASVKPAPPPSRAATIASTSFYSTTASSSVFLSFLRSVVAFSFFFFLFFSFYRSLCLRASVEIAPYEPATL